MAAKSKSATPKRLIVGISGASGVIYGVRLLETLRERDIETHLVISKAAEMAFAYETDLKPAQVRRLAHKSYAVGDVGAAVSSGSFKTMGMIVLPCSIKTMSEIATGVTGAALRHFPISVPLSPRLCPPSIRGQIRSTTSSITRSAACSTCSMLKPVW